MIGSMLTLIVLGYFVNNCLALNAKTAACRL